MNSKRFSLIGLLLLLGMFGLSGCFESDTENATEDTVEKVEETTEDTMDEAGDSMEEAADETEEAMN